MDEAPVDCHPPGPLTNSADEDAEVADKNSSTRMKSNSCARVGGKTVEQRIYRFIKLSPTPVKTALIAEEFELTLDAAGHACRRLRNKGCITTASYNGRLSHVATSKQPDDFRGLAVESMRALKEANPPKPQRAVPGKRWLAPTNALEACWPMRGSA